jgi:multicomponent Na+:H+ antiporter subunit E
MGMAVALRRFLALAGLWLVLTAGAPGAWAMGAVAAAAAAWLSLRLLPPGAPRPGGLGLLGLLPGFLRGSLLGGIDVALRAFRPSLPLRPGWLRHETRLPPGLPRVALGCELSLMPGTLAAGAEGGALWVHCLDTAGPVAEALAAEERRIAATLAQGEGAGRG